MPTFRDKEPTYYKTTWRHSAIPLDPLTGRRMRAGVIPQSILDDPRLRKGYEFIDQNAFRLRMKLLLGPHKLSSLTELGVNLQTQAQQLASKRGALFLEGVMLAASKESIKAQLQEASSAKPE